MNLVLITLVSISISSFVNGKKSIFITQPLINFVYKNLDIDAIDHCEFLFDEEGQREEDILTQTYHDLVHTLKVLNVATLVTSNNTYDILFNERKENVKFPTLHYISLTSLTFSKVTRYLKTISSIALANDMWLIVFDNLSYTKSSNNKRLSEDVQKLIPNLELDSQLFIIIPMYFSNRGNFKLYEAYKVF